MLNRAPVPMKDFFLGIFHCDPADVGISLIYKDDDSATAGQLEDNLKWNIYVVKIVTVNFAVLMLLLNFNQLAVFCLLLV